MTIRQHLLASVLILFELTVITEADSPFWRSLFNNGYETYENTGLNQLYGLSGSYYNGTAQIEINITRAAESYKNCSNAIDNRFVRELSGIFAVTPPSNNETDTNSINMITGFWSPEFNFTNLNDSDWAWYDQNDDWNGFKSYNARWTLASFDTRFIDRIHPDYARQEFPVSVSRTSHETYEAKGNLSHTLDVSLGHITGFKLPACNRTNWNDTIYVEFGDDIPRDSAVLYSRPDFEFEFDEQRLNMSLEAKNAGVISKDDTKGSERYMYQGDIRIIFHGVIDSWHSDVLLTNSSKPTWRRTVGYDEGYFAYGVFKSLSSRLGSSYVVSILVTIVVSFIMGLW